MTMKSPDRNKLSDVHKAYEEAQVLKRNDESVDPSQLKRLSDNWKDSSIPRLQRKVVEIQLANMHQGIIDPVFSSLHKALRYITLAHFSVLDIGCATGYYSEVIKTLEKREIQYTGCDYSPAMVNVAKTWYPQEKFDVQDVTRLHYSDNAFDVVITSGVLEHVPHYQAAITEICRVAKRYVIFHRCPLTSAAEHEYTIGSQYNIETPRIYFSKKKLIDEIKTHGFFLVAQLHTYPFSTTMKRYIKNVIQGVGFTRRPIKTLVCVHTNES